GGRSLKQAGQRCGDFDSGHVLLALYLLDERLEYLAFAAAHGVREGLLEFENALLIDVRDAGQSHLLDGLFGRSLDDAQHVPLAWRDEQDRLPIAPRPARAP